MIEQMEHSMRFKRAATAGLCAWLVAFGLVLAADQACADPPNYQRYVIGERALGMGGAQTAAVNDPMANLYNPAALVFISSSMVSASKAIYSLDKRVIKNGFVPSAAFSDEEDLVEPASLTQENDLSLPSTLAIVAPFGKRLHKGGPKRHALGVAILVPNQDSFKLRATWKPAESEYARSSETYSLSESYKEVWTGVSYALRAHKKFGLGASVFLVKDSYSRNFFQSRFQEGECASGSGLISCGFSQFWESDLSIRVMSLMFRVGALWEPHENWRFGLLVTPPTIKLGNLFLPGYKTEGKLNQTHGASLVQGNDTDYIDYFSDTYKLKVYGIKPMSFRAGVAYLWHGAFAADLDVSVHLPTKYYRVEKDPVFARRYPDGWSGAEDVSASGSWFDPGVVGVDHELAQASMIEREPVVNFNIGWELVIDDTWTVRNGFFTDFSSAPEVRPSRAPQLWHVNRYGVTLAGGFKHEGYDISVGFMGAYGRGTASIYDDRPETSPDPTMVWHPAEIEEKALYIFIAGVQSAAKKGAKQLYKKAKEGELFTPDEDEEKEGAAEEIEEDDSAQDLSAAAAEEGEGTESDESSAEPEDETAGEN
jgi:hypothetical protein